MKKLSILILTLIYILSFSVFFALAGEAEEQMKRYKPNKALSDYIDAEGFKFGISRSEAIRYYKFDITGGDCPPDCRCPTSFHCPKDMVAQQKPIKVGFYAGSFNRYGNETNSLLQIRKCIAIEKERVDQSAIQEAFKKKFGIDQNAFFINHHGRYILLSISVIEHTKGKYGMEFAGSAVVLSASDNTDELTEKAKGEKGVDNATDRVKKQMFK
jgi:hypothetical protein